MTKASKPTGKVHLARADIDAQAEHRHQHQFNAKAVRHTRNLGAQTSLERIGVHLVRLEPGAESTQFHYHDADEEFLYVLAGRAIAEIGDTAFEVGPGDFMGFPAPSPAHCLKNPYSEDFIYLMGGERNPADVVHYPRIRRSMIKSHGRRQWVSWEHLNELS